MAHNIIGNQKVLDILEQCLMTAREHGLQHVAVSMVGYPNQAMFTAGGDIALEVVQQESIGKLGERIAASIANWTAPQVDESLGPDFACYNAANGSLGYDFIPWLVDAEMRRVRLKGPAPLKVGFWCGHAPDPNEEKRQHWLKYVFRPALNLIVAVEDERAVFAHRSGTLTKKPIVDAHKKGEPVPTLSGGLRFYRPDQRDITITLREAPYWPHRNSDMASWHRFALDLKREGHSVKFIRDTAKAHEGIAGFQTLPLAAIDLIERMRVYETAKINFFVANGPVELAMFSDRPWLCFTPIEDENSGYRPNTPKFWEEQQGIKVGTQFPWSRPAQRIVWQPATYENICAAWDEVKGIIE